MNEICKICGEPEQDHHMFDPMPLGCVCSHQSWFSVNTIPAVCEKFISNSSEDICSVCCHDVECHS